MLDYFLPRLADNRRRVPGTAVFMTRRWAGRRRFCCTTSLHNKVLHERVVLLTIVTEGMPEVPKRERVQFQGELSHGFSELIAHYGFMQTPNVPNVLRRAADQGLQVEPETVSYSDARRS
ncbi:MAG: KUP/HAK/KT family potassium transporter [Thermoanaerobaculia bacterium]